MFVCPILLLKYYLVDIFMVKELQLRVLPEVAYVDENLRKEVARNVGVEVGRVCGVVVAKRSIDARQRRVMVNLRVVAYVDEPQSAISPITHPIDYVPLPDCAQQAVVVGMGPGGLFAALRLIELGVRPIVVERGKPVSERIIDIARISREGIIDPDSNYCFGEGGAGAYSDGKLYTRSKKRGSVERILNIFHQHGASQDILVDAHPHIGSDKLPRVIEAMRRTILRCGGEVHFGTRVTSLLVDGGEVTGVECSSGERFLGPVILATGHSARDIYEMLYKQHICIEAKGIAVGVRLEHPQRLIDEIQYHSPEGRGKYLPAAEYAFVTQVDGRGVYSFCMCPGGVVVPAASGPGQLVVNGMSASGRNSRWANSGMVVEVHPEDVPGYSPEDALCVMRFQQRLERRCYEAAGMTQRAGAQRMIDFVEGRNSVDLPPSSYPAGVQPSRLDMWLPAFIGNRLRKGFRVFGNSARGFLTNDAIVIGVETRTSSPVRIPRNLAAMHHIAVKGLYPCGEGAGYAGGIVSAAIDGERCAEALAATVASCRS